MKTFLALSMATLLAVAAVTPVHSQAPAVKPSTAELLIRMRAQNKKLLDQQTSTLIKLEEVQKEASQLRILARRT